MSFDFAARWPARLVARVAGGLYVSYMAASVLANALASIGLGDAQQVFSLVALALATIVIELPAKMTAGIPNPVRYLVIGTVFNTIRILALGLVIGAAASRYGPTKPTANDQDPTNA